MISTSSSKGILLGTNASGTAPVPGNEAGIQFDPGVTGVTIGGTVAGSGNVIADNNEGGSLHQPVDLGAPPTGSASLGNSIYLTLLGIR